MLSLGRGIDRYRIRFKCLPPKTDNTEKNSLCYGLLETHLPKCALCGTDLPVVDARAFYRDGKRVCISCAGISQSAIGTSSNQVESAQKAPSLPNLFPLVTVLLIALNIVFFVLEEARGGSENLSVLMQMGAIYQPAIQSGQYYRLVTAMFVHIGFFHLASNMYALFFIGSALERVYGHDRFIIVYLVSGVCGSILSAISIPAGIVAAGASGAILGSLAGLIVLQLRFSKVSLGFGLGSAILSLSYNILSGFVPNSGIDSAAHLGGAMAGALLSLFIAPSSVFLEHVGRLMRTKESRIPESVQLEPTRLCHACGAEMGLDSKFCTKCGTRLIEIEAGETRQEPASVIAGPRTPTQQARPHRVRGETIGVLLVVFLVMWVASPILITNPAQLLLLESSGYGGRYMLRLQNLTPWPMVVRGYWSFSPPITWSGGGPANDFTLMPFMAYTFEYMRYCTGSYCLGGETAPYVTFRGDVRLLYRTYQVEIRSINYGYG